MMFNKKILLILTVGLVLIFSVPAQALWLSGYEYRKEITIDHTKIDSDLSNFPLAVILSDTTNIVDGNDVKFTLSDGETLLDYEKEKYAVNDAAYWVNIPAVSSGIDTTFYMYYGKTGDTNESTSAVWDSNYKMVQHMEETSGTLYDSTGNANNGTPYGGLSQAVTGQIDGADYFDGSNDYINFGNKSSLDFGTGSFSVEWWMNMSATPSNFKIFLGNKYENSYGVTGWFIGVYNGTWAQLASSGGDHNFHNSRCSWSPGSWTHCVYVFQRYGGQITVSAYQDGVLQGTPESATIGSINNGRPVQMYYPGNPLNAAGTFDEIRISNTARSADWITASYYSESNNLITFGNEQQESIPEPTSLLLLGFGIIGIAVFRRRLI